MASLSPVVQSPRRSYSLPTSKSTSSQETDIEVLYTLPHVRIIAFTTTSTGPRRNSSSGTFSTEEPEAGTLSWVSRFERTIAAGAFRIYRAPGSVAFLNCQNALRPILPKSQAWCVDGDSKFVLQIRPPQYWRIEVPNKTPEEILKVEELKKVFGEVLRFEKTPCPFQRDFTVELPDLPQVIKKRPWRPVERPKIEGSPLLSNSSDEDSVISSISRQSDLISSPSSSQPKQNAATVETLVAALETKTASVEDGFEHSTTPAPCAVSSSDNSMVKLAELDDPGTLHHEGRGAAVLGARDTTVADLDTSTTLEVDEMISENIMGLSLMEPSIANLIYEASMNSGEESDSYSDATDATDDTGTTPTNSSPPTSYSVVRGPEELVESSNQRSVNRSITAPDLLSTVRSSPLKGRNKSPSPLRCQTTVPKTNSDLSSSSDSFHSAQSWHSPLAPPSPPASIPSSPMSYPYPHDNIVLPKRTDHVRDVSADTAIPTTPGSWGPPDAHEEDTTATPSKDSQTSRSSAIALGSDTTSSRERADIDTLIQMRPTVRHRTTTSSNSRRSFSPLPPAVNLFSPHRKRQPRKLQTARHLPTAILQKTYEILISPPSHLLQLMLSVASKIAAGEWRGVLSGYGETVDWDFEDEYRDEIFEDDYGISLPAPQTRTKRAGSAATWGSWEVD